MDKRLLFAVLLIGAVIMSTELLFRPDRAPGGAARQDSAAVAPVAPAPRQAPALSGSLPAPA